MDLRPLNCEDLYEMELFQATGSNGAPNANTDMFPIIVIPTSVMLTDATMLPTNAEATTTTAIMTPSHVLATVANVSALPGMQRDVANSLISNTCADDNGMNVENARHGSIYDDFSHPAVTLQSKENKLHFQQQQKKQQTMDILCTGTLTKPNKLALTTNLSGTLPRSFQPPIFVAKSSNITTDAESDFEGSECGASVSSATCIPHFRFGGCGMILQPNMISSANQHQEAVIGYAPVSDIIGTGAANNAIQSRRFRGNTDVATDAIIATLPKRVSFKGDNLTQTSKSTLIQSSTLAPMAYTGMQLYENAATIKSESNNINNYSYMHIENLMEYQATGFRGLPDVTEHSHIRRTISRQNSISNSDSGGEISKVQKTKISFDIDAKSQTLKKYSKENRKSKSSPEDEIDIVQKSKRSSCIIALTFLIAICLLAVTAMLTYQHFVMSPSRNSYSQRLRIVKRILRDVPLVDGHNNFAWNVRKYAHSSLELVHLSQDIDHSSTWSRPAWAQTDIERLKQGLVSVQIWSAYVPCEAQGLDAVKLALEQIDIIRRLSDMYAKETSLVISSQDILTTRRQGLMSSLIGIEGGHAIGSSLGVLRSFYSLGARYLSLTHKCDVSWAGSSASSLENGLTQFGKAIIREMNRLGMMIDLSYSSDATARDVLQVTRAPVIFSHSAARQLCNSTRNIPDDILRLVAENGGLIMISFDSEDVACGRQARLKDVISHIKYIRSITGIQHIGLGAGYDAIAMPPVGLEDVSKYPDLLAALLEDQNWSEEDIGMLAGKNFMRIIETVENVRDYWKRAAIQPIEQTEAQPKSQCAYMSW